MKQKPRKKKRTVTDKMTLDLKSASIARIRRMTHTPIERLVPWTKFGVVRTISKTTNESDQSGDFVNMTNSRISPPICTAPEWTEICICDGGL